MLFIEFGSKLMIVIFINVFILSDNGSSGFFILMVGGNGSSKIGVILFVFFDIKSENGGGGLLQSQLMFEGGSGFGGSGMEMMFIWEE